MRGEELTGDQPHAARGRETGEGPAESPLRLPVPCSIPPLAPRCARHGRGGAGKSPRRSPGERVGPRCRRGAIRAVGRGGACSPGLPGHAQSHCGTAEGPGPVRSVSAAAAALPRPPARRKWLRCHSEDRTQQQLFRSAAPAVPSAVPVAVPHLQAPRRLGSSVELSSSSAFAGRVAAPWPLVGPVSGEPCGALHPEICGVSARGTSVPRSPCSGPWHRGEKAGSRHCGACSLRGVVMQPAPLEPGTSERCRSSSTAPAAGRAVKLCYLPFLAGKDLQS